MELLVHAATRRRCLRAVSVIAASVVLPTPVLSATGATSPAPSAALAAGARDPKAAGRLSDGPVLVLGDSLSAEYGLKRGAGWVGLLEKKLGALRPPRAVVNASISGETTSGGRTRLPALLTQHKPALLVVELGGNDALRGLDLAGTEANLRAIVKAGQAAGARVLVLGMMMPPNYGRAYGERFASMFRAVAESERAGLVPFFLEGVAERPEWFQADRIHPTEQAQARMLENVWPAMTRVAGWS